jgi:hypothetical protein
VTRAAAKALALVSVDLDVVLGVVGDGDGRAQRHSFVSMAITRATSSGACLPETGHKPHSIFHATALFPGLTRLLA